MCPHGRPSWHVCPHCNGANNAAEALANNYPAERYAVEAMQLGAVLAEPVVVSRVADHASVLIKAQREITMLREAVKTLGANCDEECGQPEGTFAGQQFAAIDKELGR